MSEPVVRPAREPDAGLIRRFELELAAHEKLSHTVQASETDTAALLFEPQARAVCDLVELDGEPVGFRLWVYTVSTFADRWCWTGTPRPSASMAS
jgi:hypothetical protein